MKNDNLILYQGEETRAFLAAENLRIVDLLKKICYSILIFMPSMFILWWMLMPDTHLMSLFTEISIGVICLTFIILGLLHFRKLYIARLTAAIGYWLVLLIGALILGGIQSPVFSAAVPVVILLAGFLAGVRTATILGIATILVGALLLLFESNGVKLELISGSRNSLFYFASTIPSLILIPIIIYFMQDSFYFLYRRIEHIEQEKHENEIAKLRNNQLETSIQEQHKIEAALVQAKEAAESADRTKSQFLANMSHELRTPMNGVVGITNLLLEEELEDELRESLEIIQDSGQSLLTIINDILDFSKIEYGGMQLDPEPTDLQSCLKLAIAKVAPLADEKNLPIEFRIANNVPSVIWADRLRLCQILTNLISNAVKFTEKGNITVEVTQTEGESAKASAHGNSVRSSSEVGTDELQFVVRDTGIGIPDSQMGCLFKPFSQVDGSATRRYGGAGLGLIISARLVELMRGTIWVESQIDHGSAFSFTILTKPCLTDSDNLL